MECALRYRFQAEGAEREQSSAMSFGTAIHDAVMQMELAYDPQVGVDRFEAIWNDLPAFDLDYSYILPRNSHSGYMDMGHKILRDWWALIQWESDVVLAREYEFEVDIGNGNTLAGIADKVALRPQKDGSFSVLISDYKTGSKPPTREYLAHDVQFSAYCYATTKPEFWTNIQNGAHIFGEMQDAPREGEWVHLRQTKRIPAGFRYQYHYNRLMYAIEQIEESVAMGIFVPDLTGAKCEFCEYRKVCGLPSRTEEGLDE
jgi:CRISPR/Cas system-associated exonuclease Cas4 (RecB family)